MFHLSTFCTSAYLYLNSRVSVFLVCLHRKAIPKHVPSLCQTPSVQTNKPTMSKIQTTQISKAATVNVPNNLDVKNQQHHNVLSHNQ